MFNRMKMLCPGAELVLYVGLIFIFLVHTIFREIVLTSKEVLISYALNCKLIIKLHLIILFVCVD